MQKVHHPTATDMCHRPGKVHNHQRIVDIVMTTLTTLTKLRSLIFSCNISVVCNKLYVVLNNESENKMKAINFVFSILRQTYPIIAHLWYPWNEHSKTNLGYIELLIYRSIYLRSLGLRYIQVLLYPIAIKLRFFHFDNYSTWGTWLCFKKCKLKLDYYFTHISIFRFIRNLKVLILFNRKLYVDMGEDGGGLLHACACSRGDCRISDMHPSEMIVNCSWMVLEQFMNTYSWTCSSWTIHEHEMAMFMKLVRFMNLEFISLSSWTCEFMNYSWTIVHE